MKERSWIVSTYGVLPLIKLIFGRKSSFVSGTLLMLLSTGFLSTANDRLSSLFGMLTVCVCFEGVSLVFVSKPVCR